MCQRAVLHTDHGSTGTVKRFSDWNLYDLSAVHHVDDAIYYWFIHLQSDFQRHVAGTHCAGGRLWNDDAVNDDCHP